MKEKNKQKKSYLSSFADEFKKNKFTFFVYLVLRVTVFGFIVVSVVRQNWENVFTCVLTLVLLLIPTVIEKSFRVNLPSVLEVIVLLFVFAAEILGELQCYYIKYPYWDTMLHTLNGFIFAAAGFAMIDVLNRNERIKFKLNPLYVAIAAFCFSMTVGVMWEFFEYGADIFLHTDMQKDYVMNSISSVTLDPTNSNDPVVIDGITDVIVNGESLGVGGYLDIGLHDTMNDLLVNFVGAVMFSIIGFVYIKNRGKRRSIAALFIPTLAKDEHSKKEKKRNKYKRKIK